MNALAEFVFSPQGRAYAAVCERWGLDPGSVAPDDVVAFQLRYGFALALQDDESGPAEVDSHRGAVEATRNAGARIRQALNG